MLIQARGGVSVEHMAQRSKMVSLLVLVGIVVVAAGMYAAIGVKGGFVGVPRLLPSEFTSNEYAMGNILNAIVWVLLIVSLLALFGFVLYKMRGLTD
jgi:hypothetical protein